MPTSTSTRQPGPRSQVPGPSKLARRRGQPFGPVVGRDEVAPQNARARHRSFLLDLDPDRWRQFQSQSQSQLTPINQPAPPCQLPLCGEAAESRISIHLSLSLFVCLSLSCLVLSCLLASLPACLVSLSTYLIRCLTFRPSDLHFVCSERVAHFTSCRTSASTSSTLHAPNYFSLPVRFSSQPSPARAVAPGCQ